MAVGQVLGTNFVNLALILLADAIFPGEPIFDVLGPFEVVSALLGAVLIGVLMAGVLERRERTVLRMGTDPIVVAVLFVAGVALLTRR